ncbi:hypothetical protein JW796_02565 [Candidatus Dojkabacteria bacterium]|nr:hypothetical protein [Candidatus Dojkabacteria bacterium]
MHKNFRLLTTITLLVILLSIMIIWLFSGNLRLKAKEQETISVGGETTLSLSIKQLTQDPKTKEIPLALSIVSTKDSDRVQVTWEVPKEMEIIGESSFFTTVKVGTPRVIQTNFLVHSAGRFEVKAKVQIFGADVNYVSSTSYTVPVGNTLEVLPLSDEYLAAKRSYQTQEVLKYLGIGSVILAVVVVGGIVFVKWLNAED